MRKISKIKIHKNLKKNLIFPKFYSPTEPVFWGNLLKCKPEESGPYGAHSTASTETNAQRYLGVSRANISVPIAWNSFHTSSCSSSTSMPIGDVAMANFVSNS